MLEQSRAPTRADSGDVFEPTGLARFLPSSAMTGYGEAMRLVADLLDQLQSRRLRTRTNLPAVGKNQRFMTGATFLALGYAGHGDSGHAEIREYIPGLRELPRATVDQQQIRNDTLFDCALEASLQCLVHRGVVVARRDAGDV